MIASRVGRPLDTVHVPSGCAAYGKQILVTQLRELTSDYGRGFNYVEVAHMIQFAQAFPVEAIVATLSQQLSCKTLNPRETEQPLETDRRRPTLGTARSKPAGQICLSTSAKWRRFRLPEYPPSARSRYWRKAAQTRRGQLKQGRSLITARAWRLLR
jgi:hypothetical protein